MALAQEQAPKTRVCRRVVLHFPHRLVDQPVISNLVRRYDMDFNILRAQITPKEVGILVLELRGTQENYEHGINYLHDLGVSVQQLSQDISRLDRRCTHCGACLAVCPSGALVMNPETRRVDFDQDKCIACGFCIPACPTRAMQLQF